MKTKLLAAAIALVGGSLFSSGALAAACAPNTPLSTMFVGFTCTDPTDADTTFTFGGSTLPGTTLFNLTEFEFPNGVDVYNVSFSFPGGLVPPAGGLTVTFDITSTNPETFVAANLDSDIEGASTSTGIKVVGQLSNGGPLLTLTSLNGQHDPPGGGETPLPSPQTTIHVVDTLTPGTNQFFNSISNSFETSGPLRTPEPGTLALLGLGLLGAALRRRTK